MVVTLFDVQIIHGALFQITDSSVLVANSFSEKNLVSGKYHIARINYENIKIIETHDKDEVGKGAGWLFGAIGCTLVGISIGAAIGHSRSSHEWERTAGVGAVVGGIVVFIPVIIIGSKFGVH